jgi:hypothetical protein
MAAQDGDPKQQSAPGRNVPVLPRPIVVSKRYEWFCSTILAATTIVVVAGCGGSKSVATGRIPHPTNLEIVPIDSGVFAAIRKDPLSLAVNSNSLIIVRDTDVVVVDAQFMEQLLVPEFLRETGGDSGVWRGGG